MTGAISLGVFGVLALAAIVVAAFVALVMIIGYFDHKAGQK